MLTNGKLFTYLQYILISNKLVGPEKPEFRTASQLVSFFDKRQARSKYDAKDLLLH